MSLIAEAEARAWLAEAEPLVQRRASRLRIPAGSPLDRDDLAQIGRVAALQALMAWRPELGSRRALLSAAIWRAMLASVALESRETCPAQPREQASAEPSPERQVELAEVRAAAMRLPEPQAVALLAEEPGEQLGVSRQRVSQLRALGLATLRKRLRVA